MKPSVEFRRHHDVEPPRVDERAFRQGWLVRTRLDRLLADRRITSAEYQAAIEYRAAWAIARSLGPAQLGALRIASAASADLGMIARLDAATKLRIVEDAIGPFAAGLLAASVVHDLTWAAIARHLARAPQTARDWTVDAIRALAPAWTSAQAGPRLRVGDNTGEDARAV